MSLLDELQEKVYLYSLTESGDWLNDINWAEVPVIFKDKLPSIVAGGYFFGITILLKADLSSIFPLYVHELRHRWQWKMNPMRYLIGKLYRPLIENDAYAEQNKADKWFCEMADLEREIKTYMP